MNQFNCHLMHPFFPSSRASPQDGKAGAAAIVLFWSLCPLCDRIIVLFFIADLVLKLEDTLSGIIASHLAWAFRCSTPEFFIVFFVFDEIM